MKQNVSTLPYRPYAGQSQPQTQQFSCPKINKAYSHHKYSEDLDAVLDRLSLQDGMTISFHHHLRSGDYVLNLVMEKIGKRGIRNLTVCASSLFPCHTSLLPLIEQGIVTKIITAYVSGPVAQMISEGKVQEICILHSHGYRATMIETGEVSIDVAFIAAPIASESGDLSGSEGPSSCGVLGYAIADAWYAKQVVAITDYIQMPADIEIPNYCVDYVVKVAKIGDPNGIVSGTTKITRDPVGLRIAGMTAKLIQEAGYLKDGFTFQTGAGGISLAVAKEVRDLMVKHQIKGKFASGGITSYLVAMLEEGLFEELYDVQCFELDAVRSIAQNANHHKMSASKYADILNADNIVNQLDVVILGATEIDLDFNVNVTTGSDGMIMGGSGGHADTAAGAKLAIIVSKLVSSRISVLTKRVTTITTPGDTVDVLVTDRGIAIHPRHQELIHHLKNNTNLPLVDIAELYEMAIQLTGVPAEVSFDDQIVAVSQYRDGTMLDVVKKVRNG